MRCTHLVNHYESLAERTLDTEDCTDFADGRGDGVTSIRTCLIVWFNPAVVLDYIDCSVNTAVNGTVPTITATETSSVPRSPMVNVS